MLDHRIQGCSFNDASIEFVPDHLPHEFECGFSLLEAEILEDSGCCKMLGRIELPAHLLDAIDICLV
jgi:hypothetical protein